MRRFARRKVIAMSLLTTLAGWIGKTDAASRRFHTMAELRDHIIGILRQTPGVTDVTPDRAAAEKLSFKVGGSAVDSDLTDLFNRLSAYADDDPGTTIGQHIRGLTRFVQGEGSFIPVLRTESYIAEIGKMMPNLLSEPYVGDLRIAYMVDRPDSLTPVSLDDFPDKLVKDIRSEARANARRWLDHVVADDAFGVGSLYYVEGNTTLSPSLVLLDEFWTSIQSRFPGNVLIAMPRRDQLFVFDDTAEGKAIARRLIDVTVKEDFSLLSDHLYARRGGKIVLAEE